MSTRGPVKGPQRRLAASLALAFAGVNAGCGDAGLVGNGDAGDAGVGAEARVACPAPSRRMTYVLARIGFVRPEPMNEESAEGFDLDNRVSRPGDTMTCRAGDLVSPSGTPGIDNQLARLIPAVDMMTGGALDGLFQGAINNGQMLVTVTLDGVDDLCDDPEVEVQVQRVTGMPFVGSDMLVDPGQTFDAMRAAPSTRTRGRIIGGYVETTPVDMPLPVAILDAQFIMNFYGARLRMRTHGAGDSPGVLGGGVSLSEFMTIAAGLTIPMSLRNTVNGSLALFADLDRDATGKCQKISGALRILGRPAFVLE